MAVEVDIVEGTATSHDIQRGWEITRIAIVTGLNEDGSLDTGGLISAAEAEVAADSRVGPRGTPCPNISVPTYLQNFSTELIGHTAAKVKILYKGHPLPVYEFDGTLAQVQTNLRIDPNTHQKVNIETSYTYPLNYPRGRAHIPGKRYVQGGFAATFIPEPTFTFRFIVTAMDFPGGSYLMRDGKTTLFLAPQRFTATAAMTWYKMIYEGFTNDADYFIGLLGGPEHTWLIDKVSGTSRDGGLTYEAAMTLHFKGNTWDPLVVFVNPDDGLPPPDLRVNSTDTGWLNAVVIPSVTFPFFVAGEN